MAMATQFWASGFNIPAGLGIPSVSGLAAGSIPLIVIDKISGVNPGAFAQLNNVYDPNFIGVNGHNGNSPQKGRNLNSQTCIAPLPN
jgi:hypothetical protein